MITEKLLKSELLRLASIESETKFGPEKAKIIAQKIENWHFDFEEYAELEEYIEFLKNDEDISSLENLAEIVNVFWELNEMEFSDTTLDFVQEKLLLDPSHKIYALLMILVKVETMDQEELLDKYLADFFSEVFQKYPFLVEMEDFLFNVLDTMRFMTYDIRNNQTDLFIPVFEQAVIKYPSKYALKFYLADMYYNTKRYEESLSLFDEICLSIEKYPEGEIFPRDEQIYYYQEILEHIALNHDKLGDDENVKRYVDYVINNLPIVYFLDEGETEDIDSHVNSFFLRMRQNMKSNDIEKVLEDYGRIKDHLFYMEVEDDYPDIMRFLKMILPVNPKPFLK